MKALTNFASKFGANVALNPTFIKEKERRYYLLNPLLCKFLNPNFLYAGLYLGEEQRGSFMPSFNFLNMLVPLAPNKVVLENKAAWLFICGRDIFRNGIRKSMGSRRKGDYTLVMNELGECLGFGLVLLETGMAETEVVIRNLLDVGDFLRRES